MPGVVDGAEFIFLFKKIVGNAIFFGLVGSVTRIFFNNDPARHSNKKKTIFLCSKGVEFGR
jgi:hypothetical protein